MTKEQNKIAIRELEGLKEFLERRKECNPIASYRRACISIFDEIQRRLEALYQEQKFNEIPDSSSAESSLVEKIYSIEPIMPSVCEELNEIVKGQLEEILKLNQENDKLKQENAELKERLEEAWSGTARRSRIKTDEEYTAHIQQEVAAAEVVNDSDTKAEATPSNTEIKYFNWNIDKRAWIEQNNKNIKMLIEHQKNNDVGAEYDELLFKTKITDNNPSQGIIYSRIGTDDAIYKLNTIERLFRDHHIESLKGLERLLNFAKITSKKEYILLTKNVDNGKMSNGIEFDINIGMFSQNPIIKTKDFSAEIKWNSIIQIAEVSGLFDRQLEKDRQDKLNSNKEGNDNV